MIPDEVIPAAVAVVSSPKRYALLLGSGISRSAGISTGQMITDDLIGKIAAVQGEVITGKPTEWYNSRQGIKPTFSGLLAQLTKSPEDRVAVLKEYFMVADGNGDLRAPEPTQAHRTIAKLVREGHISFIITTNFDDLLERALRDEGIQPTVITELSNERQMSVVPDTCRVFKVNGDYPNTDLKITPADLESYPKHVEDYLDRILSEYGLIVCGWRGEDDVGLMTILSQDRVRRHAVYWCHRPDSPPIERIVCPLNPTLIAISSADEFFKEFTSKVDLLRGYARKERFTISMAARRVKEALKEPKPELTLPDIINAETDAVLIELQSEQFHRVVDTDAKEAYYSNLKAMEELAGPLAAMLATIAYYNDGEHATLISDTIERLLDLEVEEPFLQGKLYLRLDSVHTYARCLKAYHYYPALLAIYSAGIAAVRTGHFNALEAILNRPQMYDNVMMTREKVPFFEKVNVWTVLECHHHWECQNDNGILIRGNNSDQYPFDAIHEILRPLIPNNSAYTESFDVFGYIFGITALHNVEGEVSGKKTNNTSIPLKLIVWQLINTPVGASPTKLPSHVHRYFADIGRRTTGSEFFGGDLQQFERCNRAVAEILEIKAPDTGIELPSSNLL